MIIHRSVRLICVCLLILVGAGAVVAQSGSDLPTQGTIRYGETVEDTITPAAIFDFWEFDAIQGDVIAVEMVASDGLAPLVGIRAQTGDILRRSDTDEFSDAPTDAPVNGVAYFEFEIPETGTYTLVPTRVGTSIGDTSGSYRLTLMLIGGSDSTPDQNRNLLQPVEFRCGAHPELATTAATLIFGEDWAYTPAYRVMVIGLDGFAPVLLVGEPNVATCQVDVRLIENAIIQLPERPQHSGDLPVLVTELTLTGADREQFYLTLGSLGGVTGTYIVLIEGFNIAPAEDTDALFLRFGPLARNTDMLVYMLRTPTTRIDPALNVATQADGLIFTCDDAGRRECEGVPPATGLDLRVTWDDGAELMLTGASLDAGARLTRDDTEAVGVFMTSTNRAQGDYLVVVIGELPARARTSQD